MPSADDSFGDIMSTASKIRRWLAGVFLTAAVIMLVLGSTVWAAQLKSLYYLIYWSGCIGLTALAGAIAFADLLLVRRGFRREQKNLIEQTLINAAAAAGDDSRDHPPGSTCFPE